MDRVRSRKAQAALEFLTTYGWAILVILVMIGALAYFGVLNPKNILPDKCLLSTGLTCKDFQIQDAGATFNVRISIENNLGQSIQMFSTADRNNVTVAYQGGTPVACTPDGIGAGTAYTLSSGQTQAYTCTGFSPNPGKGQKLKVAIAISYMPVQGVYLHQGSGDLQGQVQ
jgi:hypothetical protein